MLVLTGQLRPNMSYRLLTELVGRFVRRSDVLVHYFHCPLLQDSTEQEMCRPLHRKSRLHLLIQLKMLWA